MALAVVVPLRSAGSRPAPRVLESIFQDDDHLLYSPTATVSRTLDTLKALGVDRLRVTILWRAIAPSADATRPPAGFDGAEPNAYPSASWVPYDRLVRLAYARGIGVDFDLTAPGPLWAMARGAPGARYADHWAPSAEAFGAFVTAVGDRYSGRFRPAGAARKLPRVSFWSVWNEPNQPGWLAPQWAPAGAGMAMASPALYRDYVDSAFRALVATGHGPSRDTMLVGELAPEGSEGPPGYRSPIPPLPFLRAMYCVDSGYRPLRGAAAAVLGCPQSGSPGEFVTANPALFRATGFAHHPYSFFLAPNASMPDSNFAALSDLSRMERALDETLAAYRVRRRVPLWLTEYGYETDPPNPFRGVSLRLQSLYLNEAQYMAWRLPRVKGFSQFLLYDAPPDLRYKPGTQGYWSTFQTGLLYANGTPKPSFNSYRLPLFLPDPVLGSGRRVLVWAMLRAAAHDSGQLAQIQWRPEHGNYRTVTEVTVDNPNEVLVDSVSLPGPGVVRVAWRSPHGLVHSRAVGVRR